MGRATTKTAFVLSGGASLGAIQVGMLQALYERGITADLLIGTSAGALNGEFLASRPQTVDTALELGRVWRGLSRGQIFPLSALTGALGFLGMRAHLVPDSGLRSLVSRHAVVERLEETTVPLHVIATDVLTGEEVRLSQGPLLEAVMASSAIPGVLPPVEIGGRLMMDGGVANNVPLSHALELGARRIYVLPTVAPCALAEPPHGALAMLVYATGLVIGRRLQTELTALAGEAEVVVLPAPCPLRVQPTDFGQAEMLIAQALGDSRRHLRRLGSAQVRRRVVARRRGGSAQAAAGPSRATGTRR
jgi:NTE family protein